MTRAKWAVLARLDRFEGLKQAELAEMLDLQPISLTRLLDGLADNGLIERRPDPDDRRAKRLFLTPDARPLLERLTELGEDLMETALAGLEETEVAALLARLSTVKENLRQAVHKKQADKEKVLEPRYG
jgi:MarR family transcriptional regulator for hemolysin